MARGRLAGFSVQALTAELERRRKDLPKLIAQRDDLDRLIAQLESAGEVPVAAKTKPRKAAAMARKGRKLPRNKMSLSEALQKVLAGKASMGVGDAMDAVKALGYKSTSSEFRSLVNQTLIKDKHFKNVSRGMYTVRRK